ncbi:MAG: hypothetical protein CMJ83_13930 [Planctomycetes bacterium]|nr:hypothetical protein [Planctomycetota bacterium]
MTESTSNAPFLRHTKSFKKYTEEYELRVVDYVREWGKTEALLAVHEDNSLLKVTGSKEQIEGLMGVLKQRFNYIAPEDREDADGGADDA